MARPLLAALIPQLDASNNEHSPHGSFEILASLQSPSGPVSSFFFHLVNLPLSLVLLFSSKYLFSVRIGVDIFNHYMSGGTSGIFGPSPEQYWGTLVDEVGTPSQTFTRLVLSIYEFLKATAEDRAPQMLPRALSISPLNFDDSDTKNLQITTLNQAPEFYTAMNLAHNHIARPNVPGSKMPLLRRRSGLGAYLLLLIRTDSPAMQQKLTTLLSEQKRLFLDPFTKSAFVHTTILLSCFPASPDPGSVATLAASSAKWLEKRTALIARANAAAAGSSPDAQALLAQYQSQSNNVVGARMQRRAISVRRTRRMRWRWRRGRKRWR